MNFAISINGQCSPEVMWPFYLFVSLNSLNRISRTALYVLPNLLIYDTSVLYPFKLGSPDIYMTIYD